MSLPIPQNPGQSGWIHGIKSVCGWGAKKTVEVASKTAEVLSDPKLLVQTVALNVLGSFAWNYTANWYSNKAIAKDTEVLGQLRAYDGSDISKCPAKDKIDRILLQNPGVWDQVKIPYEKCYVERNRL